MRIRGLFPLVACLSLAACGGTEVDAVDNACEDYCVLVIRNCQGAVAQYSGQSECVATCQTMDVGTASSRDGNTIACRTFWAAIAEGRPDTCTRAGPGGDGTCGTNCESFCAATMAICEDHPAPPYASIAACQSACQGFDMLEEYDAGDIGGDTFACRLYHMTAASSDPTTHCPHTGVVSAVCFQ